MANERYYLDREGLELLVAYINNALEGKANVNAIPAGVITADDLISYATKKYVDDNFVGDLELQDALSDYMLKTDVPDIDLSDYALKTDIPEPVDLSGYATTDEVDAVKALATGVYHFKGSVANLAALAEIEAPEQGDVYNLEDTGMNAAWTGDVWDEFGTVVDLTPYLTEAEVQAISINELNRILFSGKSAVVSDNDTFLAMVANDEPEVTVSLNKDIAVTKAIVIPGGKKVTLDLAGNTLDLGSTELKVSGELVIDGNGEIEASGWGINGVGSNAKITINSGTIVAQEAPVSIQKGAKFVMNGGVLEGNDNCPLMGQGSSGNGGTEMIINGGKLIAHIQSAGYSACGIYMPNDGKLVMNGGEIISDGAGIVMRAGEVELNGGSITAIGESGILGKVGDSKITVGPYAVVYDEKANYPGLKTGIFKLTIGKDMKLEGTDGDISVLMPDGKDISDANIIDNRG